MKRFGSSAIALVLLAGCSTDAPTELVVAVYSDIAIPTEMDGLRVRAVRLDEAGGVISEEEARSELAASGDLPRWVVLSHEGGPLGPIEVTAEGLFGDTAVVTQRARTSFVQGKRLVLTLQLLRSCAGIDCGDGMTCGASGCRSIEIDPGTLPEWPGSIDRVDGSVSPGTCMPASCPAPPTNAVAVCTSGVCDWECRDTFEDCDGDATNGCEVNLRDPSTCGACGNACPDPPGATPTCSDGTCGFVCEESRTDCNGSAPDGCETDLASPASCGGCGVSCADPTPRCALNPGTGDFVCVGRCPDTAPADCAGSCVDSSVNVDHCGTCFFACPERPNATRTCVASACSFECMAGWGDCDGLAANGCETPLTSLTHCGACDSACSLSRATSMCATGTCEVAACDDGFDDCDGADANGCETPLTEVSDCGGCGMSCTLPNGIESCAIGSCMLVGCDVGYADCNGNELDGCEIFTGSLTDCGGCGVACALPNASETCATGSCEVGTCDAGFGDCDGAAGNGCETSLDRRTHCGACGAPCALDNASETCATGSCEVATCDAGWGDCDGMAATGCETPLDTLTNCTACGTACTRANGIASCAGGSCALVGCNAGYGDCDADDATGCEQPLTTTTHCGGCGVACALPNATASCASGTCAVATCDAGWNDCDGDPSNGCETSLRTVTSCGACGVACSLPRATETCATGTCAIASCEAGFADCNVTAADGCEASLSSASTCRDCSTTCSGVTPVCDPTTGCVSGCGSGELRCGDSCIAVATDPSNCGACGNVCSTNHATPSCSAGSCVLTCDEGWGNCNGNVSDGCETQLVSLTNCGACGTSCSLANATESCATGSCAVTACDAGWANCDGLPANGCETSLSTLSSCGGCGVTCNLPNASESCATGTCTLGTCNAGWGNCDGDPANGCETRLDTLSNCGSCGTSCNLVNASESCSTGTCTITACSDGWDDCDGMDANGCETRLDTLTDCGSCGTGCSHTRGTSSCATGTCTLTGCNGGWGNCDGNQANGCETRLDTLSNCGSCGTTCDLANATESCSSGTCTLGTCNAGYGDCDGLPGNGCETSLTTLANCGSCGTACSLAHASESCATGTCTLGACETGWGNCDTMAGNGCETSLTTLTNCGSCGTACGYTNASESCSTGTCELVSCDAGWDDCDSMSSTGCETSVVANPDHCGACDATCGFPQECAMSTCACETGCDCLQTMCSASSPCACDPGCSCALSCSNFCDAECDGAGTICTVSAQVVTVNDLQCRNGATCTIDARGVMNLGGAGTSPARCEDAGTSCELDCRDRGTGGSGRTGTCRMECRDGAACLLRCQTGSSTCSMTMCTNASGGSAVPTACGGGVFVCNQACP